MVSCHKAREASLRNDAPDGVKFMHGGHLATLFSARNYHESEKNDSALLLISRDEEGALRVRAKRLQHRLIRFGAQ